MRNAQGGLICDHCGGAIPQEEHGHTWVGPIPAEGEAPRHYHLDPAFPKCRVAGGIENPPGGFFDRLTSGLIKGLRASG